MRRSSRFRLCMLAILAIATLSPRLAVPARADEPGGEVLIFCTDSDRHPQEGAGLNGKKYGGKGEIFKGLTAKQILGEIEQRAAAGKKIAAIEIIGHGNSSGPHTTVNGALPHPEDRLTVDPLKAWADRLRQEKKEPKDFFTPGATVTIRACYVGQGDLPKALLDILPADAKVVSDADFYKNNKFSAVIGGFWGKQRITTQKEDNVFVKGDKGESRPWSKRKLGSDQFSFLGSWAGSADVETSSDDEVVAKTAKFTIVPGNFVIKERQSEGGKGLELTFAGNVMIGEQNGNVATFEPDPERGGNMESAQLEVSEAGTKLKGTLTAGNEKVNLIRRLDLSRAK